MSMRIKLIAAAFVLLLAAPAMAQDAYSREESFAVARVTQVLSENVEEFGGLTRVVQQLLLTVESGPRKGERVTVENGMLDGRADMRLRQGGRIVVEFSARGDGTEQVLLREQYRLPRLLWLTAAFVALALLLGGMTGVTSLLGLGVSVLVLLLFVVPRIVAGGDPLLISVVGCMLIACFSLYLAHGRTRRTSVALIATLITLALAAIVAVAFVQVALLFGMGSEESVFLQMGTLSMVDLRGLLLGGMLLGALGVLDDITTAQCAAVEEISKANPRLTEAQLRLAGASVGKEHIASLINTLALAYAGASLPLLLLLDANSDFPLWVTLNGEFLAEEIVRTLVGSIALLLAVPISTALAARFLKVHPSATPVSHVGHGHHH